MQDSIIVTEELMRATEGSLENRIEFVRTAFEEASSLLFGSDVRVRVLATFEDYLLVVTDTGGCHRVSLSESDEDGIVFDAVVPVSAKMFGVEDVGAYIKNEAVDVAGRFLDGDEEDARRGIQGLIAVVDGKPGPSEEELVTAILSNIAAPRPWKRIYESKEDKIKRFIVGDLTAIDENCLRPKFRKLYDGSMDESRVSDFRTLVEADSKDAIDRFVVLVDSTKRCFEAARSVLGNTDHGEGTIAEVFSFLAEDLTTDLCSLRKMLSGAITELNRVDCIAKLYDALAESFYAYQVASCFVSKASNRLCESAKG